MTVFLIILTLHAGALCNLDPFCVAGSGCAQRSPGAQTEGIRQEVDVQQTGRAGRPPGDDGLQGNGVEVTTVGS